MYASPSLAAGHATLQGAAGLNLAGRCGAPEFFIFLTIIEAFISSNDKISGRCERITPIETPDDEYDFVVIGGGGAGSVVAARLSENPDWKVLLLEAGPDEPAFGEVPLFTEALQETPLDWNYTTTNESYACLATGGSCHISAGRMLGGSTAHNGMMYLRGNPTDFNHWAAEGNEGWTWDDVLPYYLLSEDNGEIERVGRLSHATGGPLSVERMPYLPPFGYSVLTAATEAGYNLTEDVNGKQITGFTVVQTTTKKGVRQSSATAYLRPARYRENLHISLESYATRIIIENNQTVGVEYYQGGQFKTVGVSREVILSAGAIRSPQVLLLSGIGPTEHLEAVGVKVVKDLPGTGENFHDHVNALISFTINEPDTFEDDWASAMEYIANQTGPLSGYGLTPLAGFIDTEATNPDFPDLQVLFFGYAGFCAPGEIGALRSAKKREIGIRVNNIHPKSRGRISLASNDPFEYPVIWGNYLGDSRDVDVLLYGIDVVLKLADTQAMRALNFTLSTTPIEACSNYTFPSTEYWACMFQQDSGAADWHPSGSCKMGPASDNMAVVDPKLRVHGIKGLRIADTSIMPMITSGNPGAPAMMIGDRAADFIKKDWGYDTYF